MKSLETIVGRFKTGIGQSKSPSAQTYPYVIHDRKFDDLIFSFVIADEIGKSWYHGNAGQEMPERIWCKQNIRPGFTVVDAGAHHGMMSVLFGKWVGPFGRVIAYEIVKEHASIISENAKINKINNVVVRDCGLGDENGTVTFNAAMNNVVVGHGDDNTGAIVKLDDDVPPTVKIDFMKIDVEGSELRALKGARRIVSSQRPIIDLEIHNFLFDDPAATLAEIFSILDREGYAYEVMAEIYSPITRVEKKIDLNWLAQWENPHVYCSPPE